MSEREKLLRHIVLQVVHECPRCHQPFSEEDVRSLGQLDTAWLFSLYCHACRVLAIVGLTVEAAESEQEVGAGAAQAITADDVLDMYVLLEQSPDLLHHLRTVSDGAD